MGGCYAEISALASRRWHFISSPLSGSHRPFDREYVAIMNGDVLHTHRKALRINLDAAPYGTFAEIGAGQEVARWFFRVGGAAGTIAKTMSAYDMTVSDAIYGPSDRYVSRRRLQQMLEYEYSLLLERLAATRGAQTRFFAFADTVTARSYSRQDESHGWMGVRFQGEAGSAPSQILLHLRMIDRENVQQQETLGIVGVNLLHAALYLSTDPPALLDSLMHNLSRDRIEIDLVKFDGPAFAGTDNRLTGLHLVQQGLADATMITEHGEVVQAAEILYRKPIVVVRGSFRPTTHATLDLIEQARRRFARELAVPEDHIGILTEMTLRHLAEGGVIDPKDFLDRADTLGRMGLPVLVSNYARYFRLAAYLLRQTHQRIAVAMGVRRLRELFDEKYYGDLDGGILEAFGRMFKNDLKLYIYPVAEPDGLSTARRLEVVPHLRHLHAHLLENGYIEDLQDCREEYFGIFARSVLDQIRTGDPRWEKSVPAPVVEMVKARRLFGWKDAAPG
jgi:hypothetical protein